MEQNNHEMLTVEQFAKLMQVSRTTVFGWLKNGVLQEGVHYLRLGRILRICRPHISFNSRLKANWSGEAATTPPMPNRRELDSQRGEAPVNSPLLTLPLTFSRGNAPAVNLDY